MKFDQLGLSAPIVRAIADEGYDAPTPIQAKAIPPVLKGHDVLGCAQTGTGKTAAFALPMIHRLARDKRRSGGRTRGSALPRALVLCPTRELATQIHEGFSAYGRHARTRSVVIFGGVGQGRQVSALRAGVDVLVATPGRLQDLMQQGHVDLSQVETLVLDEADHMLDMGFIRDIRRIIRHVPKARQTLLFSATMPPEIRKLADAILREPVNVRVAPVASTAELINQCVYQVSRNQKVPLLCGLFDRDHMDRVLVFTRTKHGADKLVRKLYKAGIPGAAIHGNKSQNARTRALEAFKKGKIPVLVATDIAARGIDVDDVTHVVNYDLPNVPETYVHRIGRTARAGASGSAISLVDKDEMNDLRAIERLIRIKIERKEASKDLMRAMPVEAGEREATPARREWKDGKAGEAPTRRARRSKKRPARTGGGRPKAGGAPKSNGSNGNGGGGGGKGKRTRRSTDAGASPGRKTRRRRGRPGKASSGSRP